MCVCVCVCARGVCVRGVCVCVCVCARAVFELMPVFMGNNSQQGMIKSDVCLGANGKGIMRLFKKKKKSNKPTFLQPEQN